MTPPARPVASAAPPRRVALAAAVEVDQAPPRLVEGTALVDERRNRHQDRDPAERHPAAQRRHQPRHAGAEEGQDRDQQHAAHQPVDRAPLGPVETRLEEPNRCFQRALRVPGIAAKTVAAHGVERYRRHQDEERLGPQARGKDVPAGAYAEKRIGHRGLSMCGRRAGCQSRRAAAKLHWPDNGVLLAEPRCDGRPNGSRTDR